MQSENNSFCFYIDLCLIHQIAKCAIRDIKPITNKVSWWIDSLHTYEYMEINNGACNENMGFICILKK